MSEFEELMKRLNLTDDEIAEIEEVPLGEEDYKVINSTIMNKIKQTRKENFKLVGMRKRQKLILVAAVLIVSTTLFAGAKSLGIEELFSNILKVSPINISSSGVVLNGSNEYNGVILNSEGVLIDSNTMDLIFNVEKSNGKAFSGSKIKFEELAVVSDTDKEIEGELGKVSWEKYNEIEPLNKNSNQRRFLLNTASISDMQNTNLQLKLSNIIEYEDTTITSDVNIGEYLEEFPQYNNQITVPNTDIRLKKQMSNKELEQVKKDIPKNIIDSKKLAIPLFDKEINVNIDNVGFIDGQLHIKLTNPSYILLFEDSEGNYFEPSYIQRTTQYGYYVYDIKSNEELKRLKACINVEKEINKINGVWELAFKTDIENNSMLINPENIKTSNKSSVDQIEISNLSLILTCTGKENRTLNMPHITIGFSSEEKVDSQIADIATENGVLQKYIYKFAKPINISDIKYIVVDEKKIDVTH